MSSAVKPKLRVVTYMCPSHPVELYEHLLMYLEEQLQCEASLIYESRATGPLPDRTDPFTEDSVDLAFMSAHAFVKLKDTKNEFAELLPVAAVYRHTKNAAKVPCYYSDIIIHVDGRKHVKEFPDLRGCQWAYSHENSLSGSTIVLKTLKENGENATFFGNSIKSGSHLNSILMVSQKQVEASAVDANTLAYYKDSLPDRGADIFVIGSLGPLSPYPIVINARMNSNLKTKLLEAFKNATTTRLWGKRLAKYGILYYEPIGEDVFNDVKNLEESVKNTGIGIRYY